MGRVWQGTGKEMHGRTDAEVQILLDGECGTHRGTDRDVQRRMARSCGRGGSRAWRGTGGAVKRGRGRGMQGETRWMGGKVRDAFGPKWCP